MSKSDALRDGAPGESAVHLCVDMQRMFAEGTEWKVPWLERVLPNIVSITALTSRADYFYALHPRPKTGSRRHGLRLIFRPAVSIVAGVVPSTSFAGQRSRLFHVTQGEAVCRGCRPKLVEAPTNFWDRRQTLVVDRSRAAPAREIDMPCLTNSRMRSLSASVQAEI